MTLKDALIAADDQYAKAHADRIAAADAYFPEAVKELFGKYPEMTTFSWTQYTPLYIDGDPCRFGLCFDDHGLVNDKWGWEKDDDFPNLKEACEAVSQLLYSLPDDWFEEKFGDGVRVIVSREGVETEEYQQE